MLKCPYKHTIGIHMNFNFTTIRMEMVMEKMESAALAGVALIRGVALTRGNAYFKRRRLFKVWHLLEEM